MGNRYLLYTLINYIEIVKVIQMEFRILLLYLIDSRSGNYGND